MSGGHDDYASEPIRGLPERLPAGENILWQGVPLWWELAKHVYHIRVVAVYFGLLLAWRGLTLMDRTGNVHAAAISMLALLPVAALGLGLLALLAWLSARTTVYTITNRRVAIRAGLALTVTINIPFRTIGAGDLRAGRDGRGDIVLSLLPEERSSAIGYSTLWPHVRPWRWRHPEPMLRGVADAASVAAILGKAVAAALPSDALAQGNLEARAPSKAKAPRRLPASPALPAARDSITRGESDRALNEAAELV